MTMPMSMTMTMTLTMAMTMTGGTVSRVTATQRKRDKETSATSALHMELIEGKIHGKKWTITAKATA